MALLWYQFNQHLWNETGVAKYLDSTVPLVCRVGLYWQECALYTSVLILYISNAYTVNTVKCLMRLHSAWVCGGSEQKGGFQAGHSLTIQQDKWTFFDFNVDVDEFPIQHCASTKWSWQIIFDIQWSYVHQHHVLQSRKFVWSQWLRLDISDRLRSRAVLEIHLLVRCRFPTCLIAYFNMVLTLTTLGWPTQCMAGYLYKQQSVRRFPQFL